MGCGSSKTQSIATFQHRPVSGAANSAVSDAPMLAIKSTAPAFGSAKILSLELDRRNENDKLGVIFDVGRSSKDGGVEFCAN